MFILIFLLAVAVLLPILNPLLWPHTHEDMRFIFLMDQFKEAAMQGHFYPRWLPDLCGGYGYPTFVFYPPAFFYFALPFSLLPGYPVGTMHWALLALLFIGAAGVYQLGREISDKITGLFLAALFLLTPYLYVNLYVRGALSELTAMLLTPWPIFFLLKFKKSIESSKASWLYGLGIALSICLLILSHPATTLFYVPIFGILALFIAPVSKPLKWQFYLGIFCFVLTGFLLASPYWRPLILMKQYVNFSLAVTGPYSAELHTVDFLQFFKRDWGFGISTRGDSNDLMSFQLGLPHFIFATAGAILGRKNKLIITSYVLYIALIVFMTPLFSYVWENAQILRFVQFPWRILSVTAILQIICATGISYAKWPSKTVHRVLAIFILVVLSGLWHSNQFKIDSKRLDAPAEFQIYKERTLQKFYTLTQSNEYIPVTVKTLEFYPRGSKSLVEAEQGVDLTEAVDSNSYHIKFDAECSAPSTALINQFYLKGWVVKVDSKELSGDELRQNLTTAGCMRIPLSSGKHTLEAYYDKPDGWQLYYIFVGLGIFALVALFYFFNFKIRKLSHEI